MNGPRRDAIQEHALRSSLAAYTEKHQYQRRLINNNCTTGERVVGWHAIPRNYMRRLPGPNRMKVFTKRRFGRPESNLPMNAGINDATVGYFTCKPHDDLVQAVDRLGDIATLPDQRTLGLMCYRSILYNRWWMHLWAQASERARDEHGADKQYEIARLLRADDQIMLHSQFLIESSLACGEGPHQPYHHLALRSHGRPTLAAAVFGVDMVQTNRSTKETSSELGQWGLTLVPGCRTNTLILHFPADSGTQVMDMALPSLSRGRSKVPGREVTRAIFGSCYDVVFSEDSWKSVPGHEQDEVINVMASRSPVDTWTIDIFKGSEWEIA